MMKHGLYLSLWLLCIVIVTKAEKGLSVEEKRLIVKAHNRERRRTKPEAADMRQINWDRNLEELAGQWVSNCNYRAKISNDENIGANYFFKEHLSFGKFSLDEFVRKALRHWTNRKKRFEYKTDCGKACTYVKMINAFTDKIGCAFNTCPSLSVEGSKTPLLVCYYSPSDFNGSLPYQTGPVCSQCPDGWNCKDRLCFDKNHAIDGRDESYNVPQRGDKIQWQDQSLQQRKRSRQKPTRPQKEIDGKIPDNSHSSGELQEAHLTHLEGNSKQSKTSLPNETILQNVYARQYRPTLQSQIPGQSVLTPPYGIPEQHQPIFHDQLLQPIPSTASQTQSPGQYSPSFQNHPFRYFPYTFENQLPGQFLPTLQNPPFQQSAFTLQNKCQGQTQPLSCSQPFGACRDTWQNQFLGPFQTGLNERSPWQYNPGLPNQLSNKQMQILLMQNSLQHQFHTNVQDQPAGSSQPCSYKMNWQIPFKGQRQFDLQDNYKGNGFVNLNNQLNVQNECNVQQQINRKHALGLQRPMNLLYPLNFQNEFKGKSIKDRYQVVEQYPLSLQKPLKGQDQLISELESKRLPQNPFVLQSEMARQFPLGLESTLEAENKMTGQFPFGMQNQMSGQYPLHIDESIKEQSTLDAENQIAGLFPLGLQNQIAGQILLDLDKPIKGPKPITVDRQMTGQFPLGMQWGAQNQMTRQCPLGLQNQMTGQHLLGFDKPIKSLNPPNVENRMAEQFPLGLQNWGTGQFPSGLQNPVVQQELLGLENLIAGSSDRDVGNPMVGMFPFFARKQMNRQYPVNLHNSPNVQRTSNLENPMPVHYPEAVQNQMSRQYPFVVHQPMKGQSSLTSFNGIKGRSPTPQKGQDRSRWQSLMKSKSPEVHINVHQRVPVENQHRPLPREEHTAMIGSIEIGDRQKLIEAHDNVRRQFDQRGLIWDPYLEHWSKRVIRCEANFPGLANSYTNFAMLPLNEPLHRAIAQWMEVDDRSSRWLRNCRTAYDEHTCTPFRNMIQSEISQIGCAAKTCKNYLKVVCIYDNMEARHKFFRENQKGNSKPYDS